MHIKRIVHAADATGRARTIQVEVRKKRTFIKRDDDVAVPEAQAAEEAPAAPPAPATMPVGTSMDSVSFCV